MSSASSIRPVLDSYLSAGIAANNKGRLLKKDASTGKLSICTAVTDVAEFALVDNTASSAGDIIAVAAGGIVPVLAGTGGLAINDRVVTDAAGAGIKALYNGQFVFGICRYAASAGEYAMVEVVKAYLSADGTVKSMTSGGILITSGGLLCKQDSTTGKLTVCSGATDPAEFVVVDNLAHLDTTAVLVYTDGLVPVRAGVGGLAYGDLVGTDTDGTAIKKSSAKDWIFGICRAPAIAGATATVEVQKFTLNK